jgi:hypothetical protein
METPDTPTPQGPAVSDPAFYKPPDRITVFFCSCGAPPTIDPRNDESTPAPKCRSHPYPARALGPPMERVTYVRSDLVPVNTPSPAA